MQTRSQSSVLGKRSHQADGKPSTIIATTDHACSPAMPTPELTPKTKRARISLCLGDSNKENVPPFSIEPLETSSTASSPSLGRASTEIITPPRVQTTVARHASTSSIQTRPTTPATSMSALALTTPPPTPHVSLLPIHARARALLRSTCNGNSAIAGRTVEREIIKAFISSWEDQSTDSSLFVSGTPGTGKTAIVNTVLAELGDSAVDVISVNCMAYQNVDALRDHLRDAFTASEPIKVSPRKGKAKAKPLLEDILASRTRKCLLVLDELDHIANSCKSFASVFLLSRKYATTLRIIGIANTHTLTASTALLGDDAAGISTLHFGGYTSSELLDILNTRLSPLYESEDAQEAKKQASKFLPSPTLTLLAKKVASQTGDVRMLFGVLRGAIDMAMSSSRSTAEENPLAAPVPIVAPNHVLSALKAYLPSNNNAHTNAAASASPSLNSEIATKVRGLGLHARLTLLSILLAMKRMEALLPLSYSTSFPPKTPVKRTSSMAQSSKSYGLDLAQLHTHYSAILERAEQGVFIPVSRSEFVDLIGVLETSGLVASSTSYSTAASPSKSGRRGFGRTASFGGMAKGAAAGQDIRIADTVRTDEVLRGLGVADALEVTDPREEEVRAIWIRENTRIAKDAKACAQSKKDMDVIDGAFEH